MRPVGVTTSVVGVAVVINMSRTPSIERRVSFRKTMRQCVICVYRVALREAMLSRQQQPVVVGISAIAKIRQSAEVLSFHRIGKIQNSPEVRIRCTRTRTRGCQPVLTRGAAARNIDDGVLRYGNS